MNESGRRRWGRKDQHAVAAAHSGVVLAEHTLERAAAVEAELRERFTSLTCHQRKRQEALTATDAPRKLLKTTLGQLEAALDHTLPDRTRALAEGQPAYLVERLGPVAPPPVAPYGPTTPWASRLSSTAATPSAHCPLGRARP